MRTFNTWLRDVYRPLANESVRFKRDWERDTNVNKPKRVKTWEELRNYLSDNGATANSIRAARQAWHRYLVYCEKFESAA